MFYGGAMDFGKGVRETVDRVTRDLQAAGAQQRAAMAGLAVLGVAALGVALVALVVAMRKGQ